MTRSILAYGASAGLLIAVLRFIDYRFLVIEHSIEIYGALIAALFAAVGIWFGLKLTKEKIVVTHIEVAVPAAPFVFNQAKADELTLTRREMEVLGLMAAGLSNKEMAERLFVSENTIKTHCSRVFDKLGAGRRTQAVQIGKQHGLIP
ncbi:MAG: response regulator transcription factor [Vicinamibacterales bacterium]